MEVTSSSRILIGLSLDPNDSKELLSWAIRVLANPNDTIVAVHVLVGENMKKHVSVRRRQSQLRQAKAYVISVLGEFAQTCWSKQVNLEAKVALNSTVGGGLVEEAKSISADFLLLRGSRNKTNNSPRTVLLDGLEGQSNNSTEDDTFSTRASSMTYTPSSDPKIKRKSKLRKSQFSFSYENISNATDDFHQDNLVGRGGYSEVYKGVLCDGETIAVKRLAKDNNDPNKEKEFLMEL
ncbi:putative receptor-like serine threonine-protein kinase, partial [Trifolium pratense]